MSLIAEQIILRTQFIPDREMEVYLKAADVLVLPYKEIFQSGVLFLAYSFGLPVVATDVGSFREEIVEGQTGFLCRPGDPADLARTPSQRYFASELYRNLGAERQKIKDYAESTIPGMQWRADAKCVCGIVREESSMKPLVSILIPAYNAEAWLADTLRSAMAQTWDRKGNHRR